MLLLCFDVMVFQTGFLYWINTTSFEVDYAKDLGTKGVYAAVFAPDYGTFVCADLSGSLFHATFAGIMLLLFLLVFSRVSQWPFQMRS